MEYTIERNGVTSQRTFFFPNVCTALVEAIFYEVS